MKEKKRKCASIEYLSKKWNIKRQRKKEGIKVIKTKENFVKDAVKKNNVIMCQKKRQYL